MRHLYLVPPAFLACFLIVLLAGCATRPPRPEYPVADFETVSGIFEKRCLACHGDGHRFGVPSLRRFQDLVPVYVTPGEPERSRLLQVIYPIEEEPKPMPPAGHRVTASEKNLIGEWILQGALWPEGAVLESSD